MPNSHDLFRTLVFARNGSPGEDDIYNHYPIAENVARMGPDDLVVSDYEMHRAMKAQSILTEIVKMPNKLVVTDGGKHNGWVWDKLPFKPAYHYGDHLRSDVQSPKEHGIVGVHVAQWANTRSEDMLREAGMTQLAALCKEARLTSWHPSPLLRQVQLCQTGFNFPILWLASCLLRDAVPEPTRLLFSGRDCYMWQKLHEEFFDWNCRYWLTSCHARLNYSTAYKRYTEELGGSDFRLVDLSGSGNSFNFLCGLTGWKSILMYKPLRMNQANPVQALVQSEDVWRLEQCNRAPEKKYMGETETGHVFLDRQCTTQESDAVVAQQCWAFQHAMSKVRLYKPERPIGKRSRETMLWLLHRLVDFKDAVEPLRRLDIQEDAE
jgi:hypothetical protein